MTTGSHINTSNLIPTIVNDVARDFISLADVLRARPISASQVTPVAIEDEFTRFKVWAGNIGAHHRGRRSLEYRLRDAVYLNTDVIILLRDLSELFHDAIDIVKGDQIPWDAHGMPNSDSDSGSDASGDDFTGTTELQQLFSSIESSVTSLFRLSMAIRNPASTSHHGSTITVDKSYFEEHDIAHVRAKYPDCVEYLAVRLGRAISARRQYLSYREEHRRKLSKAVEKIGLETLGTEYTANSTDATMKPTSDTEVSEEHENVSQTSYATSVNIAIKMPPIPEEAYERKPYECPLCFMIISIYENVAWKTHVFRDLHPYCCTFEDCTTADRLYDSSTSWFRHELQAHRSSRVCIDGCEENFLTQDAFEQHIHDRHAEMAPSLSVLNRISLRRANILQKVLCPLCNKMMSLKGLRNHLASHQQQLALFALPLQVDGEKAEEDESHPSSSTEDNDSEQSSRSGNDSYSGQEDQTGLDDVRWPLYCDMELAEATRQEDALMEAIDRRTRLVKLGLRTSKDSMLER